LRVIMIGQATASPSSAAASAQSFHVTVVDLDVRQITYSWSMDGSLSDNTRLSDRKDTD